MADELTWLEAIEIVLNKSDRALNSKAIVREIRKRQLRHISPKLETPWTIVNARISEDIKRNKDASRFKRVARGQYTMRNHPGDEYTAVPAGKKINPSTKVMVFPTKLLDYIGRFHGVRKDFDVYATTLLDPKSGNSRPMSRLKAEKDENHKQIVSYVIIKYKDSLLRFTRGSVSTVSKYLYGEYSIGFGGHLEETDWNLFGVGDLGFQNSVARELEEEVGINPLDLAPHNFRMIGVLNDDSTPLGRCHFAFIHLVELPTPDFKKGEKSVNDLRFIEIPSLSDDFAGYEYWSKLCIQSFFSERLDIDCHIHCRPKFSLKKQSELILIVGYIGSGKSEACHLLEEEFGYTFVPCSRIMQNIIGCEPIENIGRRALQDIGYNFINQPEGHEKLAQGILDYMKDKGDEHFVLDGLRYPETLEALSQQINFPITTIYIESTVDNLFQYYKQRERESEEPSFAKFLEIINHPVESEIERFWPEADITVYNHGTLDSYLETLRNYFKSELGQ